LHVYEYNLRAKKAYENCGFRFVKILKNEHFYDKRYWDTYEMEY
jgi:RimJ/RimL family protein N-acetyltransferase